MRSQTPADDAETAKIWKDCKGLAPYELWEQAAQLTAQQNGNRSAGNGADAYRVPWPVLYRRKQSRRGCGQNRTPDALGRPEHGGLPALYKMIYYLIMHHADTVQKLCNGLNDITRGTRYSRKAEPANLNPSGFVVDSLHCALHCLRSTKNFEAAVVKAANLEETQTQSQLLPAGWPVPCMDMKRFHSGGVWYWTAAQRAR